MRRGCLFGVGGVLVLCLVACGLLYFVGLPRIQDRVADDMQEGVSTVVAQRFDEATPGSGTVVITEEQLNAELNDEESDDIATQITPDRIAIELNLQESGEQNVGYSAVPIAQDGELVLTEVDANNGFMQRFLPKDKLADAVEDGVNDVLAAQNLELVDVTLGNGEMTLTTVRATE